MYENREAKSLKKRREKFVQLGKAKYGEYRYGYAIAIEEYKNNRKPVHLICNKCKGDPFPVIPFAHTFHGINDKGSCPNCYIPKNTVKETRWDPSLPQRIKDFRDEMKKRHKGRYSYPYLEKEYKTESSRITVVCNKCKTDPYQRLVKSLKDKNRYGGCEVCNKEKKAETIKKKNKTRQLRNHRTKDEPRDYGCIYKITNTKNGKSYIGYTNMTAKKRFKAHVDETRKLAKGYKKSKSYLHNAMNYHGIENFNVTVLEEFTNVTPIYLGKLEIKYIANEKPHYNVSPGGELAHPGKKLDSIK